MKKIVLTFLLVCVGFSLTGCQNQDDRKVKSTEKEETNDEQVDTKKEEETWENDDYAKMQTRLVDNQFSFSGLHYEEDPNDNTDLYRVSIYNETSGECIQIHLGNSQPAYIIFLDLDGDFKGVVKILDESNASGLEINSETQEKYNTFMESFGYSEEKLIAFSQEYYVEFADPNLRVGS